MGDGGKLDCWSKPSALFSHLQSTDKTTTDRCVKDKISEVVKVLSDISDNDIDIEEKFQRSLLFCVQQLRLLLS